MRKCRNIIKTQLALEAKHASSTDLEIDDFGEDGASHSTYGDSALPRGPIIRCREGISAIELLIKHEIFAKDHFSQYNQGGYQLPDEGWTTEMPVSHARAHGMCLCICARHRCQTMLGA